MTQLYSGPSGKFRPHVDTPRGALQFGSLVVFCRTRTMAVNYELLTREKNTYGTGATKVQTVLRGQLSIAIVNMRCSKFRAVIVLH